MQSAEVGEVVALLNAAGAQEFTLAEAERITAQAMELLMLAVPDEAARAPLQELTGMLLKERINRPG